MDNEFLLQKLISVYETQCERYDTYVKLALTKGSSQSVEKQLSSNLKPFDETFKENLNNISDEMLAFHLENSILKLIELCINGPIIHINGNSCKISRNGVVCNEHLAAIADGICTPLYERCQPIVKSMTEQYRTNFLSTEVPAENDESCELEHQKDNKRVNNLLSLSSTEEKVKLVRKAWKNI
jgi:hypothetical protein